MGCPKWLNWLNCLKGFELTRIPFVGLVGITLCLVGVLCSIIFLVPNISLAIRCMQDTFNFRTREVAFLENYRSQFLLAAFGTICLVLLVLFIDFVLTNARATGLNVFRVFSGPMACLGLMCAVTVALIVWLWIFHKITQAQLLHHIFYETCVSNLTPKTMDLKFILWFLPLANKFEKSKGDNYTKFCNTYIGKSHWLYEKELVAIGLVIIGLLIMMFCLAKNFGYTHMRGLIGFWRRPRRVLRKPKSNLVTETPSETEAARIKSTEPRKITIRVVKAGSIKA